MEDKEPKPVDPTAAEADRLEKALADLEARKKAAAELAAANAPQIERLRAAQAKLEALPQRERREVLDALGLKHVSAAPRPIEPIRGSGLVVRPAAKFRDPRWALWQSVLGVELWQAVLLSLGIEPDEAFKAEACAAEPKLQLQHGRLPREFFERRQDCFRALSTEGPIRPRGALYPGVLSDPKCSVMLADVGAFLARAGFSVPVEMAPALVEGSGPAGSTDAEDGNTWLDGVRGYVVEFQRLGKYTSAKKLFAALEKESASQDSPFERGSGTDRGKLLIRETGAAVAEKTLSNRWKEIREAAR